MTRNLPAYIATAFAFLFLSETAGSQLTQVRHAFQLCLARPPKELEQKRLEGLLVQQLAELSAAPQEVRELVPAQAGAATDMQHLAGLTAVMRVLLNLDEFITRE